MVTFVHENLIDSVKRTVFTEERCDYGLIIDASLYSYSVEAMTIRTLHVDAWDINE